MHHNEANNMTQFTPIYMCHFQIFDKINSFLNNGSNVHDSKKEKEKKSTTKKVEYEEPLNLHIFCWLAVILFRCGFRRK